METDELHSRHLDPGEEARLRGVRATLEQFTARYARSPHFERPHDPPKPDDKVPDEEIIDLDECPTDLPSAEA